MGVTWEILRKRQDSMEFWGGGEDEVCDRSGDLCGGYILVLGNVICIMKDYEMNEIL
jgi:hypothetical protein